MPNFLKVRFSIDEENVIVHRNFPNSAELALNDIFKTSSEQPSSEQRYNDEIYWLVKTPYKYGNNENPQIGLYYYVATSTDAKQALVNTTNNNNFISPEYGQIYSITRQRFESFKRKETRINLNLSQHSSSNADPVYVEMSASRIQPPVSTDSKPANSVDTPAPVNTTFRDEAWHLGAPIYALLTNTLSNTVGMVEILDVPTYVAFLFSFAAAFTAARIQYCFVTKMAVAGKVDMFTNLSQQQQVDVSRAMQLEGASAFIGSLSEGGKFGFATAILLKKSSPIMRFGAAFTAFSFRFTAISLGDAQQPFFANGIKFIDTWAGAVSSWLRNIPFLINFNNMTTKFVPIFEGLLHSAAVHSVLNSAEKEWGISSGALMWPLVFTLGLAVGSGERHIQRSYNVEVMKKALAIEAGDLSTKLDDIKLKPSMGLAWLLENVLGFLEPVLSRVLNGRIYLEPLGIFIAPYYVQLASKMIGQAFIGTVAAIEVPGILDTLGKRLDWAWMTNATIQRNIEYVCFPVFVIMCLWTAYSTYKAAYIRTLAGETIGVQKELAKVHGLDCTVVSDEKTALLSKMSQPSSELIANRIEKTDLSSVQHRKLVFWQGTNKVSNIWQEMKANLNPHPSKQECLNTIRPRYLTAK